MKCMTVEPHLGCGEIKFGMTSEEVERLLGPGNYQDAPLLNMRYGWFQQVTVHIGFMENRVVEIEIADSIAQTAKVLLLGVDVFHEKAEDVIAALEKQAACSWDLPDKELSTAYEFGELGIALWRESAFHPKLYEDPDYMREFRKMSQENQDEELRFWRFQSLVMRSDALLESMSRC